MSNHTVLVNVMLSEAYPRHAGVYRIATFVRELGWDCEVLDFTLGWSLDELKEFAKSRITKDTKFIGFSQLITGWTTIMENWCRWMREMWPHLIFIAGSPAPPVYQSKELDYYISGYGEEALIVLLKYLFSNGPRPIFDLSISTSKKIISADKNYKAFPYPKLTILYEDRDYIRPEEWIAIETSRGCIFKCDFCSFPILGVKEDYTRSQSDFEVQVKESYNKWGITRFNVVDSTFNDKIEKIEKYADVVQSLSFKPLFGGYIRADLLVTRPRDREELARMNFVQHFYGIESFNKLSTKAIHKGLDPEKMKEGLLSVRDYFVGKVKEDYIGCIGLIIGLPHETKQTIENTLQWLENNWSDQALSLMPLSIWRKEFTNNTSAISLDYKKYGFTEMSNEDGIKRALEENIDLHLNLDPSYALFSESGVALVSEVLWQNEHMDIFDSRRILTDAQKRLWWRDNHFSLGRKVLQDLMVEGKPFMEWYKEKKLGR
jgi:radical SAM superfamily enzyme YgiQ (UPF0313 family)